MQGTHRAEQESARHDVLGGPGHDAMDAMAFARPGRKDVPFVKGKGDRHAIDPDDVRQRGNGSCAVLSTLETLAQQHPGAIRRMIHANGDGTYTVTFHERGDDGVLRRVQVTVNGHFDNQAAGRSGDRNGKGQGEIWPRIIEKAYARHFKPDDPHYRTGESPVAALEHLLGRQPKWFMPPGDLGVAKMDRMHKRDHAMVAWTPSEPTAAQRRIADRYDLVTGHAYSVYDVVRKGQTYVHPQTGERITARKTLVVLDNPWGSSDAILPYAAYRKAFEGLTTARTG